MRCGVAALVLGALIGGSFSVPSAADGRPDLVHAHASQRYDRSIALLRHEVDRFTARPSISLLTWTEVQEASRRAQLHRRGDGWGTTTDSNIDVAIMWRRDRWHLK